MVLEEYSSSDQNEMPVGASFHLNIIPPVCNIQQGEGMMESELETLNSKQRQRNMVSDVSNWHQTLPSVPSAKRFSSTTAVDAITLGGLFVDIEFPKEDSSQRAAMQKSINACDTHTPSSLSVIQEGERLSEQWDAKGQTSLNTPLDALVQENLKHQTTEEAESSVSVELERERWGEETQMEQQPESMDMDMNDVEWEIGTQKGGAFITQRFANVGAGSEVLSETSSVVSGLLSSYDESSTMRRRMENNKLQHSGNAQFVSKNITQAGTGRKPSVLTKEEEQRTNQIINQDEKLVGGVWDKIESQNYLASVKEEHLADIESRLQTMQATHLKCRESWFSKDKKEINPAVDLTESTLPRDNVLQKERSSIILKKRLRQLDDALQMLHCQECELPLKDDGKLQGHHSSILDSSSISLFFAKKKNLMAFVTRPIHDWEITEAIKQAKQEGLGLADRDELDALMSFVRHDLMIIQRSTVTSTSKMMASEFAAVPPLPPLCH